MRERKIYYSLDWLRVISCIGIIMMHMLANNTYTLSGFIFKTIIPSFSNLVFLFMSISSFGMCCGYFEPVMCGRIDWTDFYKKRYLKILPFFAVLIILDLVVEFSKESVFEAVADISLLFGLFPSHISVIGVGWFLGVVFAFYLIFPFFCVLIEDKKRAWLSFGASIVLNYICGSYFGQGRSNIVFCLCYFIVGGLIYLYQDNIKKINRNITAIIAILSIIAYYIFVQNTFRCLVASSAILIFAVSTKGGYNKFIHFLSGISMEIYLSHMMIFRIIEKVRLNNVIGNGICQYIFTVCVVLIGTICFSVFMQKILFIIEKRIGIV